MCEFYKISWKLFRSFIKFFNQQNAKILSIEKVEVDIDSNYIKASPKVVKGEGGNNEVNLDLEILKDEPGLFSISNQSLEAANYWFKHWLN